MYSNFSLILSSFRKRFNTRKFYRVISLLEEC